MRNAVIMPLHSKEELVIATDNHGSIGEKAQDAIHISNEAVGYAACRVAMMELLAVGGKPLTIVMQNFTGDAAWEDYKSGVQQVLAELQMDSIAITGSTESNFPGIQSGLGLTIIGTRAIQSNQPLLNDLSYAVIGLPLVGEEVKEQEGKIAPLSLFKKFCEMREIVSMLPVGSKGIRVAWQSWTNQVNKLDATYVDLSKSAGPATCFLIAFKKENSAFIQQQAGKYYHELIALYE